MQNLKSTGVADIGLHFDGINSPAIRLYTSVGFEMVGELYWFEFQVGSSQLPQRSLAPARPPPHLVRQAE